MSPRQRDERFDQRRREIAEAAARVFAERGFQGATNREIAAAAGISPGLIYWYFESKEDLFTAVFEQVAPFRLEQSLLDPAHDGRPLAEVLERVGTAFLAAYARPENQRVARVVMSEVLRFPEPARRLGDILADHGVRPLARYLEREVARDRIRPVDPWLTAQAFFGALMGYGVRKRILGHDDLQAVDDGAMAAAIARLFAAGLCPPPTEREEE